MSLLLTPIHSDNFTRADENPLSQGGLWTQDTHGDAALQIVSDVCELTTTNVFCAALYSGVSLPNDQYASATLVQAVAGSSSADFGIRLTDNGSAINALPAYLFSLSPGGGWAVTASGSSIMGGSGLTVSPGDVFTIAVVGTTVYAFQNSTQLGSVTNASLSSGESALAGVSLSAITRIEYSNWVVGSAAQTTFSISGNAGVGGATVSWSGTSTGSTTADGSGNYSITGLAAGNYTVTPSLAGYTFSPTSQNETITSSNITNVNFTATSLNPVSPTLTPGYGPRPCQVFGVVSSGGNAGAIAAVAVNATGNLCISGSNSGSINSIDILGSIADAIPVMIMGDVSGSTLPGSTALFGVNSDQFGNLLCSIGTGGGNSYPSLDTPTANREGAVPIQIFGRIPSSGLLVGVPCSLTGALGNNINAISGISPNTIDVADNGTLVPVVLVARIATGYPNAGKLVMVSLDQYGCLCVAGSSGSSTTPSAVLGVKNGVPVPVQLYQRDANNQLRSIPLTSAGSLSLN